jgi:hypothetical protein
VEDFRLTALVDKLEAIKARDLAERSLTPGEAADILTALRAAQEYTKWLGPHGRNSPFYELRLAVAVIFGEPAA